jgi:hypothetical protein
LVGQLAETSSTGISNRVIAAAATSAVAVNIMSPVRLNHPKKIHGLADVIDR